MKFKITFDLVQNIEKQMKFATKKELKKYEENEEEFIKNYIENLKETFKNELSDEDYCWIENIEVEKI